MNQNQNETIQEQRIASRESRVSANTAKLGPSIFARNTPKRAFTLTELLVVITIIAVLAGLITVAVAGAMRRAKEAAIILELQQLGSAVEDFKNNYGAYPPNAMSSGRNFSGEDVFDTVQSDFERMFKKAFPRHQEPVALIRALVGNTTSGIVLPGGMTASEAMVFWLGGFSSDPQYPISGPGGPSFINPAGGQPVASNEVLEDRNWRFEFDLGRLVPRLDTGVFDDDTAAADGGGRFITYVDPVNSSITRRINLWRYLPGDSSVEVAYFDTSRHDPEEYDLDLSGFLNGGIFALKKLREGYDPNATMLSTDVYFANNGKFQILHCGVDDAWGNLIGFNFTQGVNPTDLLFLPEGPFIGDVADNLTHFTQSGLAEEQE